MDKTSDVKCPQCNSNKCVVVKKLGLTLGCKCYECDATFIVPDTDGVPTLVEH